MELLNPDSLLGTPCRWSQRGLRGEAEVRHSKKLPENSFGCAEKPFEALPITFF